MKLEKKSREARYSSAERKERKRGVDLHNTEKGRGFSRQKRIGEGGKYSFLQR
jgi:hypothetical protein